MAPPTPAHKSRTFPARSLTLNLSVTPSVMLTVNSAILGGRALPFLRSGSYSVFVFTTTLSGKQRSKESGARSDACRHTCPARTRTGAGTPVAKSPCRQQVLHRKNKNSCHLLEISAPGPSEK